MAKQAETESFTYYQAPLPVQLRFAYYFPLIHSRGDSHIQGGFETVRSLSSHDIRMSDRPLTSSIITSHQSLQLHHQFEYRASNNRLICRLKISIKGIIRCRKTKETPYNG
jgi:hypothetical protein